MSEQLRESLSALLDDEADELELERVLKAVSDDQDLRQTWIRYSVARTAAAAGDAAFAQLDVSARVRNAIAADVPEMSWRERMARPIASLAVAASVAAAVVFGGQQLAQINAPELTGANAIATAAPPVGLAGAMPLQASYGTQPITVLQPATRTAYQKLASQRMQRYMQDHAQHAALNSPQGLIPFARVPKIKE